MRAGIAAAIILVLCAPAAADSNDLVLSRLGTRIMTGGTVTSIVGQNLEFRALASQLGVVLAPHLLTPADSIGFSGFQFTVDYAMTTIDQGAPQWRALEASAAPTSMRTVGLFARKGMWFP